jgi:hypothetical protein
VEDDVLLQLQRELDPYAHVVGHKREPTRPRVVACSYTNMTEDYIRRNTVTGVVAFLYRMLDEHKLETQDLRWTPAKAPAKEEQFTAEEIEKRAAAMTDFAKILREKEKMMKLAAEACKAHNEKCTFTQEEFERLKASAEKMKAEGKQEPTGAAEDTPQGKIEKMQRLLLAQREAQDEYVGTLYVATLEMRRFGLEADQRLEKTEEEAKKYPKSAAAIGKSTNLHRGILPRGQQQFPEKKATGLIRKFLNGLFEYNPDAHVRSAYDEVVIAAEKQEVPGLAEKVLVDPYDADRIPLNALLKEAPPTTTVKSDEEHLQALVSSPSEGTRQRDYNTLCRLLDHPYLANIARYMLGGDGPAGTPDSDPDRRQRWRRMLLPEIAKEVIPVVPPQDTFHRLNFYLDANMEAIRAATDSIYHEKPLIDFMIQMMDSFEGTPEEVKAWGERFRDENQDRVMSEIKLIEMGGWTALGEFTRNRQIADVYNSQTEILRRILERHESDKKFGKELMQNRIKKEKAKNIAESGPDAPGLGQYKETFPVQGAVEGMSAVERKRLERTKGNLKAAEELRYYEQYEVRARALEMKARLGELSADEQRELEEAYSEMEKAREMLEVPDDAIQVDVWTTDAKGGEGGTMTRTKLYTKAADAKELEDQARRRKAIAEGADPDDPATFYPPSSRDLARKAFAEGKSAPDLAPFAQDFFQKDLERERKERETEVQGAAAEAMARITGGPGEAADAPAAKAGADALAAMIDDALDSTAKGE